MLYKYQKYINRAKDDFMNIRCNNKNRIKEFKELNQLCIVTHTQEDIRVDYMLINNMFFESIISRQLPLIKKHKYWFQQLISAFKSCAKKGFSYDMNADIYIIYDIINKDGEYKIRFLHEGIIDDNLYRKINGQLLKKEVKEIIWEIIYR